jgi:dienelactone hydrolase
VGMTNALDGWGRSEFTADGRTRDVFTRGSGPGVIVIHEIPGITPKVAAFANDVVSAGFTVVMPSLVGTPGRAKSTSYEVASMLQLCIAREFTHWALQRTSPIIAWLRALAADVHASAGGPGVGAVGMCFSGGFALGMMVDTVMVAPVLSQPSLPVARGKPARHGDLNLSPADAQRVAERAAAGCEVLGLRFDEDKWVGTRFDSLRALLGDAFIAVELHSTSKSDHSVLTEHRHEPSVQKVIDFLQSKLRP